MKRVLIVEDHSDIRKLIRMTLEFEDCEIHEAGNGANGLRMAIELCPDFMLLDIMMPGATDGLEVCRAIKSMPELASTKIVMLTARGQQHDIEAGREAGADEYLIKPFSPLELIQTFERMMVPA